MTEKDMSSELDSDLALTDEDTDDVAGGVTRSSVSTSTSKNTMTGNKNTTNTTNKGL